MSTEQALVKVLVADDGRENRDFIVDYILTPNGFTPLIARDGIEALEIVDREPPDIILLDLQMPRLNGMQVLDGLQQRGLNIPVILMTFHGSEEVAVEVYRKGVRDYVKKPYTVEEMLAAIERALSEVRLRHETHRLTERLMHANAALRRRIGELNMLYEIGRSVTALASPDQLLPHIVDAAVFLSGSEQAALYLWENNQLICRAQRLYGERAARSTREFSSDRTAMTVVDQGERFVPTPDQIEYMRAQDPTLPTAIASVPLKIGDRVIGVLSVENVTLDARLFNKDDGSLLDMLGNYAAIAIENARNYVALERVTTERTEALRSAFARYVAPSVVDRVLKNPEAMQLGGTRREITVIFADVRGYTAFSEQAEPEDVVKLLNTYFTIATDVIFSREGTLDKFLGDAVMALFNAPEDQEDHPYRAVDAALALQRAFAERSARGEGGGLTFGIAVHLGEAVVGNVGTARAMNYTAIGDTINVAKRLQERAEPGQVLITREVYQRVAEVAEVRHLGEMTIKGRHSPVTVYELLSLG